jgi:hypothetical protein
MFCEIVPDINSPVGAMPNGGAPPKGPAVIPFALILTPAALKEHS